MNGFQPKLLGANSTLVRTLRSEAAAFTLGTKPAPLGLAIPDKVAITLSTIDTGEVTRPQLSARAPMPASVTRPASGVAAELPVPPDLRSRWGGDTTVIQTSVAGLDARSALATVNPYLASIGVPAAIIDSSAMSFVSLQMRPPKADGGPLRLIDPPPAARTMNFLLGLRTIDKDTLGLLVVLPSGRAASTKLRLPLDAESDDSDDNGRSDRRDRQPPIDLDDRILAALRPLVTGRAGTASAPTGSTETDESVASEDDGQNRGYGDDKDQDWANCFFSYLNSVPEWYLGVLGGVCAACVTAAGLLLVPDPFITWPAVLLICSGCAAAIAGVVGVGVLGCHEMLGD